MKKYNKKIKRNKKESNNTNIKKPPDRGRQNQQVLKQALSSHLSEQTQGRSPSNKSEILN